MLDSLSPASRHAHVEMKHATPGGRRSVRWCVKKATRKSLAACTALARQHTSMPRLRVLTYHRFGDTLYDPFCVRVKDFEAQMALLAEHRLAASVADLEDFLAARKALPHDAVLVTVDDGFCSLHSLALPILQRYQIPAVAFVPVGQVGQPRAEPQGDADGPERHLAWEEVIGLSRAGITIGSHAWTHRSMGRMSAEEAREEAARSRAVLEDHLGVPVTSFAYPFGTRADFNATTAAILECCGYTSAFTSQHGAIAPGSDAFMLPRIKVEGGETLWVFRRILRGGLDGWRWIDRTLWKLQANR